MATPVKVTRTARGKSYLVWRARFADPRSGVQKTRYFRTRREAQAAIDELSAPALAGEALQHPIHLPLHLYTVAGTLSGEQRSFGVVCCHAAEARAMVARQVPAIDSLRVVRGGPVHFVVVGDTQLLG